MDYNGDKYINTEVTNFEYDDALIFGYANFDFEIYNDHIYMAHYYPKEWGNYDIKLHSFDINGSGFADTFMYSSNGDENIDYGINILFGTNIVYYVFLNYIIHSYARIRSALFTQLKKRHSRALKSSSIFEYANIH